MSDPLAEGLNAWADGTIKLQKENAKLRAALERIARGEANEIAIARAALNADEETK